MAFKDLVVAISRSTSPKRRTNERQGVSAWHPFYAGYSEGFVEDCLRDLPISDGGPVVDPWNGSGTTTLVCQRNGVNSIGIEINPVMVMFAQAKSLWLVDREPELLAALQSISSQAHGSYLVGSERLDPGDLSGWVSDEPLRCLTAVLKAICGHFPTYNHVTTAFPNLISSDRTFRPRSYSDAASFFIAAAFRVLRSLGSFGTGSNPTWLQKQDSIVESSFEDTLSAFQLTSRQMLEDLRYQLTKNGKHAPFEVWEGNSRRLPFLNDSIGAIITSPPYCTRIDYAMSTKPEMLLLGFREKDEFDLVRRNTMGAPVITDKSLAPRRNWGKSSLSVLARVADHPAKASRSYYLPNLIQYFRDAEESLSEIVRVLRPGATAAIVVQSSYFKEVEIPLGDIYTEMTRNLGVTAVVARREKVRQHKAHQNLRSSTYMPNKIYYEDVVLVRKPTRRVRTTP